jgi:hypothetical protein
MGVVFRATDVDLQRSVAIKFLSPELADDGTFRERFVRESRLAAAIDHPAIVPIYESGSIGGSLFIAMRFVPGQDLGRILRAEAPLDVRRTLRLMAPIADALDAAHRRGLVHRDVKPANVLVERDGVERAYLSDFGLSRRLGETTLATRSGPLGTIDYIAPEQVESGTVDGRADQYALACLIAHCLTGGPPFGGESEAAVLYAQVHTPPPRLSERAPGLAEDLDDPVARAMAKDPEARFADCRTFVDALVAAVPGGTAQAADRATPRSVSPPERGSSTPTGRPRRRALIVGGVLVAGFVVAGSGTLLLSGAAPVRPRDVTTTSPRPAVGTTGRLTRPLGPRDGELIVFASDRDGDYDLYAIGAGDRGPRRLLDTPRDERTPAISPDGRTIAYTVGTEPRDIWLMDADGGHPRRLIGYAEDDTDPAWSSDGSRLAFASKRGDPFYYDVWEVRTRGGGLDPATARNLTGRAALEHYPSWRPGGSQLVISSNHHGGNRDIFRIDASDPAVLRRLTSSDAFDFGSDVSPDGESVAFYRRDYCPVCPTERGQADIIIMSIDGSPERSVTRTSARDETDPAWSPDGRALVFAAGPSSFPSGQSTASELMVMSADGRRTRRLTEGWTNAVEPAWGRLASSPAPDTAAIPAGSPPAPDEAGTQTGSPPPS